MTGERHTARRHSVAVIPGDGIGSEVVPAAVAAVDAVAAVHGFTVRWTEYPWGSDHYRRHGRMMAVDGLDLLSRHDAILLGAVGTPDIPDDVTLWGLLIPIRRQFDQYVNLRPVRSMPGVRGPLRDANDIDLVIVRENVEGEYSEIGGRFHRGRPEEMAIQEAVFTRAGVARVAGYAARLASERRGGLTSATKSNGIIHTMPFWDEVVAETVAASPGVALRKVLIDALAAELVLRPERFDVIVASNLFGDILSDLASALTGSIGLAASANLNPERKHPSLFEPVHGSAPDIAGKGIANPVGQIWSAALMLRHLGEETAAQALLDAVDAALAAGVLTPDLGGNATTGDFVSAVVTTITATASTTADRSTGS
ncbi:tartrate dehydrogenase [Streptomyces sp. DSM 3412]|uniref:D-malate dehydrogenase (decarboxylating) n=1 Tax=Streptomyces gottesmaniae TaxID=3075518 RepID=A0ABU2Z1T1_9ACTN|nr:tartrate dehydrogenase [Streptomyces sp. DSM 3412]MDT0570270.1 tartrate dehydrogenase [Streptomyces sp. DSM 3412]